MSIVARPAPDLPVAPTAFSVPAAAPLTAVRVDLEALAASEIAWANLCGRSIEPNVFLDPAFALPLLRHVPGVRYAFLQIWEEDGPASFGRLVGLFPLAAKGLSAHGFAHPQVACGTPLVDAERADEVVDCALSCLGRRRSGRFALILTAIPRAGAFRATLDRVCARSGRLLAELATHERAALYRASEDAPGFAGTASSAKRRKEYARQVRRLSEIGTRTYTSARAPEEVAPAMERFLALESAGWKGARGTAFGADRALATFARETARALAAEGRCRIDALEIDGRPVAMGLLLRAGDRDYFWKTAFDERHAALSPGVQFVTELSVRQLADPGVVSTDSCAVADHPMIDRLWRDRLAMADLIVAVAPGARLRFAAAVRIETARRAARRAAKALWLRLARRTG